MASDIRSLMNDVVAASYDPSAIYRSSMRTLQSVMNGEIDHVSPINPVVSAIEIQAALTAAFTEVLHNDTRKLLQVNALTPEDLYPHMADVHFTSIFNLPSRTLFTLVFNKNEIFNKLVPVPGTLSSKLTIPRHSYFTISDYVFGIHYPIDIVQQSHGAIRITYDTDIGTPLQSLETNVLPHRFVERDGIEYLAIDVIVHQFSIVSKTPTVTPAMTFKTNIAITDLYYATRIYRTLANGNIEEIKVTYSEEIYDPLKPTAVVKLTDGNVNITIPQIYINSGLIAGELRIDVYQTKGPVETNFSNYPIGSIGYRFRDLDKRAITTYTAPMMKLGTCHILGENNVSGGVLAMSFTELRDIVIADAIGDPTLPITPAQIKTYLNRRGYDIIKNTDIVTDRVFLATRDMPAANTPRLLTSANASIETMNASFSELITNSNVIDNGITVTITPNATYRLDDGILKLISDGEMNTINQMRSDLKAAHITENNYLYSPYYYVLDKSNNQFRMNAYYLDNPGVDSQTFINDNETTLMSVNTNGYLLRKTDTGYVLQVKTSSDDTYQELNDNALQCLLGFRSPTETDMCWMVGTLVSKDDNRERVFEFVLDSRFSLNSAHHIDFRNFNMYDLTQRTVFSGLEQSFTLIYGTTVQMGPLFTAGSIDSKIPRYLAAPNLVGITEESFVLNFGDSLVNLWSRARSVASTVTYETHPIDVILRYQKDVYQTDENGNEIFFVDDLPQRILLHKQGDPVLADGNEIIQFPKGSIVLDENGLPVVKDVRYLKHRFELFLIEGVYKFSNDEIAITYRTAVARTVASWISDELRDIQKATMDKSSVYFYPKTVFGSIEVLIGDGIIQQINAGQKFTVKLTVSDTVMANSNLKDQLKSVTVSVIANYLVNRTLSHSALVDALKDAYGDDVIDVQISMFGPLGNIPVLQIVNEIHRCGIRKRIVSRDDEKLVVEEDISTSFVTL